MQEEKQAASALHSIQQTLSKAFKPAPDVVYREIKDDSNVIKGLLVYIEGLINDDRLEDHVLRELLGGNQRAAEQILDYKDETFFPKTVDAVAQGKAVLFVAESSSAYVLSVQDPPKRGISEPGTEAVIRGPREGFTERIGTNMTLVRLKLKTPKLKFEPFEVGALTKTRVCLAYIDGVAKPSVIQEARKRIGSIEIDGVLESGYIEEFIEDRPLSPFPQLLYTERPDAVAGQLLDGQFAIFVDGTPFVLAGPVTMWSMLRAPEDYYERSIFTTPIVWLRYFFLLLALFLPALYIATSTFHQDLLPTTLVLSFAASREAIPFPALIEALLMEVSFEALREAGIRLPKTVGQAVSILGALVIGQAAVQAGIVSAPVVMIVALTGIASFTVPRFNFAFGIRLLRFPLMFLAASFGLYGIIIGTLWIAIHLCSLHSFGVPYLSGLVPLRRENLKDIAIRSPWYRMKRRASFAWKNNRTRLEDGNVQNRRKKN